MTCYGVILNYITKTIKPFPMLIECEFSAARHFIARADSHAK